MSILSAVLLLTYSCTSNDKKLKEIEEVEKATKSASIETGDFIQAPVVEISEPAAVYFHPDSIKLDKLEEAMGENFFTAAEESMFNISSSREFLIKQKVKILETEARELHFKKSDGSVKVIDLQDAKYTWGLFLFNGQSDPVQADLKDPAKQFNAYMK